MISTPDPIETAAALHQRLDDVLDFLGHDVREGHSSTLALLELQRIKSDPMTMLELVERIERNARRSLTVIDDYMDIARARSQPLRLDDVDLGDLLVEAVADAWSAAQLRGVRVQVADTPEASIATADRDLMSAAVAKLLRDVIARTPSGVELHCALRLDGADWIIEIDDPAGATADAEVAKKKAARRERAEPGAALTRVVSARHGGTFHSEEHPQSGWQLRLRLPIHISRPGSIA